MRMLHRARLMLDAGAYGIICPMVNTPDQARALVSATRYAPLGTRSYGPTRAGSLHPDYVARSGGLVQVFAMIETAQALAHSDAIMQVEGLSGVYVNHWAPFVPFVIISYAARGT